MMKNRVLSILLLGLLFTTKVYAENSMRNCMLLPIKDSVDGAVAFKVFEVVEQYLKESEWCYYKPNSQIMDILSSYKKNIYRHLENKEVLRIIAEKSKVGSLIKVEVNNLVEGVEVNIKIVGDNGDDIFFKEQTQLKTDDITVIAQTVKNWLDVFEKSIPYNGKIIGVLGNQFTVDMGQRTGLHSGNEVIITRPTKKKRHPLLKEIVDWDTVKIGSAKIFHATKFQSQGQILQYDTRKRLQIGDWVIINKVDKKNFVEEEKYKDNDYEFGKLGTIGLFFNGGKGSASIETTSTKKIGGTIFGLDIKAELWATRTLWGGLEIGRKFGTLKKEEGAIVNSANSESISRFRAKFGYKYLPLGFFYGPQIDGYLGYASYTYSLDTQTNDGFTEFGFKGILLGVKGSIPIQRMFRAGLELGFLFNPKYSEEVEIYGSDDSASSYFIDIGGSYLYSPNMSFNGGYEITSSKAKFVDPQRSVKLKESVFKIGTTFTY